MNVPFALWLTGAPGSGKSTIAGALKTLLHGRSLDPVVLESDFFLKHFPPGTTVSEEKRTLFYQGIVEIAGAFLNHEVSVIIDATASRASYRTLGRDRLRPFAEVFVDCPEEIRAMRDTKDVHHLGRSGTQGDYEAPMHPELHLHSDREDPQSAARKILDFLISNEWISSRRLYQV